MGPFFRLNFHSHRGRTVRARCSPLSFATSRKENEQKKDESKPERKQNQKRDENMSNRPNGTERDNALRYEQENAAIAPVSYKQSLHHLSLKPLTRNDRRTA